MANTKGRELTADILARRLLRDGVNMGTVAAVMRDFSVPDSLAGHLAAALRAATPRIDGDEEF